MSDLIDRDVINIKKEMEYAVGRLPKPEVIADGTYKDIDFKVLNLGSHPVAYIHFSEDSELGKALDGKDYDTLNEFCSSGHMDWTYDGDLSNVGDNRNWYGWDYAHFTDYVSFGSPLLGGMDGRKYTTKEIVNDVKNCIDHLKEIEDEILEGLK